jgi:hypothetical protein
LRSIILVAWLAGETFMHILPAVTCGTFLSLICCASTALGAGPPAPQSAPLRKLTVRLVDASGKPVAGAHVGLMAHFWRKFLKPEGADDDGFTYSEHSVSDAQGIAQIELPADEFKDLVKRRCLVARHAGRGLVAIADLGPETIQAPFDVTLVPECRVSGKLLCTDLDKRGRKVGWTNVELYVGKKRILWCASEENGDFHFFLPPGPLPGPRLRHLPVSLGPRNHGSGWQTGAHRNTVHCRNEVCAAPGASGAGTERHCRLEEQQTAKTLRSAGQVCAFGFLGPLV